MSKELHRIKTVAGTISGGFGKLQTRINELMEGRFDDDLTPEMRQLITSIDHLADQGIEKATRLEEAAQEEIDEE